MVQNQQVVDACFGIQNFLMLRSWSLYWFPLKAMHLLCARIMVLSQWFPQFLFTFFGKAEGALKNEFVFRLWGEIVLRCNRQICT